MGDNTSRKEHNEDTLITATSHRQRWGGDEDAIVMEHNYPNGTLEAAYTLGRSFEAVQRRRYDIKVRLQEARRLPEPWQHTWPPTHGMLGRPQAPTPLTLEEACAERTKQLEAGVPLPTIVPVHGGYNVIQGTKGKEV